MKRNLRGMKNTGAIPDIVQAVDTNAPQVADMEQAVRHYQDKSEDELMSELRRMSGSSDMNAAKMQQMAGMVAPMLTPEQQRRMQEILRSL